MLHLGVISILLVLSIYLIYTNYDIWHNSALLDSMIEAKCDQNFRCKIFRLDRFAYMDLPVENPIKICDYVTQRYASVKDVDHIALDIKDPKVKCCYTPLVADEKSWSKLTLGGRCENIGKTKVKVHHQFIQVSCNGPQLNFTHSLSLLPLLSKNENNISNSNVVNVILLLFDGISRRSFNVHLPLTRGALLKLQAVEFTKYMRVGEDAFENLMALSAGFQQNDSFTCWNNTGKISEGCPFIWNKFAEKGYVTAFLDDSSNASYLNFERKGFIKSPFDYYLKPYNLHLKHFKEYIFSNNGKDCIGNKLIFNNFLEYTKTYLRRMNLITKKHFTIVHSSLVRNETTLSSLDRDFYEFLQFLTRENISHNTIIFISSNQGSADRKTINFESPEINLPFLFIYLPPIFKNITSGTKKSLLGNFGRLTTAFDVHETLNVILKQNFKKEYGCAKALSLFTNIPKSRSCVDAGVPDKFCSCSQTIMEKMDGSQIYNIATIVLNHINTELGIKHEWCAKLQLDRLVQGTKVQLEKSIFEIKVTFSTKPGSGIFRALVLDEGYRYNVKEIYRTNSYKHESCIVDEDLERFCYCPEHKTEL